MIIVKLFQFGKKENSTAVPGPNAVFRDEQVLLKADCSVLTPILELRPATNPQTWNPTDYNYAYIAEFKRYYYITDWTWKGPNWECTLKVDPLASHKASITGSTKYVLRSASDYNAEIMDTLYSPTAKSASSIASYDFAGASGQNWSWDPSDGCYVIGVLGNSNGAINGVTYYKLTSVTLRAFINYMYTNILNMSWDSPQDWNAVISKAFVDPMDYIVSAYWFPFPIGGSLQYETMKFGFWETTITQVPIITVDTKISWNVSLSNPVNPYYTYGAWELLPPFANYTFKMNPFGMIPLNPLMVRNAGGIYVSLSVDKITGLGLVEIKGLNGLAPITQKSTMFGIPIPIGRQRDNILSMLSDTVSAIGPAAAMAGTGNIAGAAAILTGASVKYIHDMLSTNMQASGTTGSYLGDSTKMSLIANYVKPQTENNREFGRALCADRLLSTLSGYTICADGEIAGTNIYDEERSAIEHYLTSGFYIE